MEELDEAQLHKKLEDAFADVKKSITRLTGHIASQQGRAMPQILKSVIPVNSKTLLDSLEACRSAEPEDLLYLLYDVNDDVIAILPKVSSFFAKSSFFSFPAKLLKAFELFNKRIYGYIQMVYILCTDCELAFSVSSMISDNEALEFWIEYFGEEKYAVDYEDFKECYKEFLGNDLYEDPMIDYSPVVTASKFGKETQCGFEPFTKRLTYENPFVYDVREPDDVTDATAADPKEATKQMDSKYFFIVSGMITESKAQLCLTIKDTKPGTPVGLMEFNGSFEQQWKVDGKGCIVSRATGLALDVGRRDPKARSPIVQWTPDGSPTQIFLFGMDGTIRLGADQSLCLDDDNGNTGPDSVIILYGVKPGSSNQLWNISPYVESVRKSK